MALNCFYAKPHKTELRFVKREKNEKLTKFENRIRHSSALVYPTINAEFCDYLCGDQFVDALHTINFV